MSRNEFGNMLEDMYKQQYKLTDGGKKKIDVLEVYDKLYTNKRETIDRNLKDMQKLIKPQAR